MIFAQQLVITGKYADGSERDLTPLVAPTIEANDIAGVKAGGLVVPKREGSAGILIQAGGQTARIPVTVKDLDSLRPVSFRHEVIAARRPGRLRLSAGG